MEFLGCKDKTFEQGKERFKVPCLKTLEQNLSMRCFVAVLDLGELSIVDDHSDCDCLLSQDTGRTWIPAVLSAH